MIRVLIAEDQAMVLGALATLLEIEQDLEVVARARDGAEALELARSSHPDVVVTDIEMPAMTGLDLAAALRRDGRRPRSPPVSTSRTGPAGTTFRRRSTSSTPATGWRRPGSPGARVGCESRAGTPVAATRGRPWGPSRARGPGLTAGAEHSSAPLGGGM